MADIENFIDAMINKDHVRSNEMFADLIGQKVDAALDAEKVAVASNIFNTVKITNDDLLDDELEAAANKALEDEEFTEYEFGDDDGDEEEPAEELEDEEV
jgi:hypothetical protein